MLNVIRVNRPSVFSVKIDLFNLQTMMHSGTLEISSVLFIDSRTCCLLAVHLHWVKTGCLRRKRFLAEVQSKMLGKASKVLSVFVHLLSSEIRGQTVTVP